VASTADATQTAPEPTATACAALPTSIVSSTVLVSGSTSATVRPWPFATHSDPAPNASPLGSDVDRHDLAVPAVDPRDGSVQPVGDPHRAGAGGHGLRTVSDGVLGGDPAAVGVDQPDLVLVDPRQAVRPRHAADAERHDARKQQQRGDREQWHRAAGWRTRGRRRPRGRRRGGLERRVLSQDRLLEALQLGTRLDADLLDQHCARLAVGVQRVALTAVAIERQHALRVQPLAQRMLVDERLELADQLAVAARREVGVDRHFGRAHAQLAQPVDLGGGERLVGHVGERRAVPQRERLPYA
jgi:hypothetical protein